MAHLDGKDNFYRHYCDVIGQKTYLAVCIDRMKRIAMKTDQGLCNDCAGALRHGKCPAKQMLADELAGKAIYYRDRDDAGPGVVRRRDLGRPERTPEERAQHHAILAKLGIEPDESNTVIIPYDSERKPSMRRPAKKKAQARANRSAFDLTDIINEEIAAL